MYEYRLHHAWSWRWSTDRIIAQMMDEDDDEDDGDAQRKDIQSKEINVGVLSCIAGLVLW